VGHHLRHQDLVQHKANLSVALFRISVMIRSTMACKHDRQPACSHSEYAACLPETLLCTEVPHHVRQLRHTRFVVESAAFANAVCHGNETRLDAAAPNAYLTWWLSAVDDSVQHDRAIDSLPLVCINFKPAVRMKCGQMLPVA
jgi:hypothetical protein